MKVKQCQCLSWAANRRRCWMFWAGGDRPFFPTSNSSFPEGKGGWRAAPCLGQCGCAELCSGKLRWLSSLGSLPCGAAHPTLHLPRISCGTELLSGSGDHVCVTPSSLWRRSVPFVSGYVSLLFTCPWCHFLRSSFPGSLHCPAHPFDCCCCSAPATEPPCRV